VLDEYSGASSIFRLTLFFLSFSFALFKRRRRRCLLKAAAPRGVLQRNAAMMMRSTRCRSW
jgi:hypothetical protein